MNPLWIMAFYLIGVFPTGYLVARFYGIDIRNSGSGNVGATNLARVVGKRAGVLTLAGDLLKGVLGVALAESLMLNPFATGIAACFVVAGHCFSIPPWLKGGKGVATSLGVLAVIQPLSALVGLFAFVVLFKTTRLVSLSSILATATVLVCSFVYRQREIPIESVLVICMIVIFRHSDNITRLLRGQEKAFAAAK